MLKDSIRFPILTSVASVIWQLIDDQEVKWIDNIGISFVLFMLILIYHWIKIDRQ